MKSFFNNKITDISEIDWDAIIKNIKKNHPQQPRKENGREFWNKRAPSFAEHALKTKYANDFIKIMNPLPTWTVFDMGSGPGTIALPLAEKVKRITAVDISDRMLEILREEAGRKRIKNIKTVRAGWDDDWASSGIGVYDVAISSRSLAVDDFQNAVEKLSNAARKRVMISVAAGGGPVNREIYESTGRKLERGIDYIYFYNLVYQMGINAHISFIEEENQKVFNSFEEACISFRWMFREMTNDEELRFTKYLKDNLKKQGNKLSLNYKNTYKWVVIWWDKED
jgi:SAM-dependent methyltransferase